MAQHFLRKQSKENAKLARRKNVFADIFDGVFFFLLVDKAAANFFLIVVVPNAHYFFFPSIQKLFFFFFPQGMSMMKIPRMKNLQYVKM
jgi:hypothetical protein